MTDEIEILPNKKATEGLPLFSPTAIDTSIRCPRRWAWRKIAGIEAFSGKGADLGGKVHKALEKYLTTGEKPDFREHSLVAKIATAGLHLLPTPMSPDLVLEEEFFFRSPRTNIAYHGFKDAAFIEEGSPVVLDHKTTKDIAQWAKTAVDLQYDAQATLYGLDAMYRHGTDSTVLRWVYYQTSGAIRAEKRETVLDKDHALEVFSHIEAEAKTMAAALADKTNPLDLPPNPDACGDYGGCPYKSNCKLSPRQQLRSLVSTNSLVANLRNRVQGAPATATSSDPPERKTVLESDKQLTLEEAAASNPKLAWLTAPAPDKQVVGSIQGQPVYEEPPRSLEEQKAAVEAAKVTAAQPHVVYGPINPPESALPPPPLPPVEEPKKRGGGRPKGSKNKPKEEALSPEVAASLQAGIESAKTQPLVDLGSFAKHAEPAREASQACSIEGQGWTLYVDCLPIGRPAVSISQLIAKAQENIAAEHNVADYRFIDYGKGVPLFIGEVVKLLDGRDVVLDSRTPEGVALLETLMAEASFVIRGFR